MKDRSSAIGQFGIITALPIEFAAMNAMLDDVSTFSVDKDPNDYATGLIPSKTGGSHRVVVTLLKKTGNNSAAAAATNLLRSFPNVSEVLMVGIAGGIPRAQDVEKHVRLGDLVISNEFGVIQYDNVKLAEGIPEVRDSSTSPSAALVGKVRVLEAGRIARDYPWEKYFSRGDHLESAGRPPSSTDRLFSAEDQSIEVQHPKDPVRRQRRGKPKLHYGRIGSANTLLKDPKARDALGAEFKLRAFEMEGSGIADATWIFGKGYLLIRGVADYCDLHKNDVWCGYSDLWQGHASVIAAAYARCLIGTFEAPENNQSIWTPYMERLVEDFEVNELRGLYLPLAAKSDQEASPTDLMESVQEILDSRPGACVAVLGDYGSGKSEFSYRLAYEMATRFLKGDTDRLPIMVSLKYYNNWAAGGEFVNFHDYLDKFLRTECRVQYQDYMSDVYPDWESGRILLILDGFDEMTWEVVGNTRRRNFDAISKVVSPAGSTVLTCRTHYFPTHQDVLDILASDQSDYRLKLLNTPRVQFSILEITPLEQQAVLNYVEKRSGSQTRALLENLEPTHHLLDLARRPLLLEMICITPPDLLNERTPETASGIYSLYMETWLDREKPRLHLPKEMILSLMEKLAWDMFQNGRISTHNSNIPKILRAQVLGSNDYSNIDTLDNDLRTCTFLKRDQDDNYEFMHRSFLEYFVAIHVVECIKSANLQGLSLERFLNKEICTFALEMLDGDDADVLLDVAQNGRTHIDRYLAVWLLARLDARNHASTLLDLFAQESSPAVLREILVTLTFWGERNLEELVAKHLRNPIRYDEILQELVEYYGDEEEARNYLRGSLDPQMVNPIRLFHMISMAAIGDENDIQILSSYNDDEDRILREVAGESIIAIKQRLTQKA